MQLTKWAKEMVEKYKKGIANAFIITGNIGDYAIENILLPNYLKMLLLDVFKAKEICFYDIADGADFSKGINCHNESFSFEKFCRNIKLFDRSTGRKAYILRYPEFIIPQTDYYVKDADMRNIILLHKALNSVEFLSSENIFIMVTESVRSINYMFLNNNSKTALIEISLPDEGERLEYINYCFTKVYEETEADRRHNIKIDNLLKNMRISKTQLAQLTAGLTKINIEDIILYALSEGTLTREMIIAKKKELIQKEFGEIIEILDTEGYSLDKFAGQEHIKNYFKEAVIDAIKNNDISIIPKGVLFMGPPGTGKTYFAKCLAGDAGINFVEFKMSKILDKWVGESEKRLEKAFSVFRALAPVGVFMDEVDQALSRGDGDSHSVNKNLFGMFLAEMSRPENRGKIIWIGATNYPNKIDEALKRAGRFDKKIPFFAPTDEERAEVFKIHLKKASKECKLADNINIKPLVEGTKGYTQAEIENIVVKALELTKRTRQKALTQDKLMLAMDYMLSAQNERIKEMEDIALKECNDQEFIPKIYRERHKKIFSLQ